MLLEVGGGVELVVADRVFALEAEAGEELGDAVEGLAVDVGQLLGQPHAAAQEALARFLPAPELERELEVALGRQGGAVAVGGLLVEPQPGDAEEDVALADGDLFEDRLFGQGLEVRQVGVPVDHLEEELGPQLDSVLLVEALGEPLGGAAVEGDVFGRSEEDAHLGWPFPGRWSGVGAKTSRF